MDKPAESEKVACAVCQAEIPKAAALHAEGKDYVYHFCDTACFKHWDEGHEKGPEKT